MPRENFSRKRVAILEALTSTTVHPTAEWVYNKLKPDYSDLSLGTVYRNIKKFCDEGKAISVGVFDGQEHFDGDTSDHAHFVCKNCGAIIDIKNFAFTQNTKTEIANAYGFDIYSEDVIFKGICSKCKMSVN